MTHARRIAVSVLASAAVLIGSDIVHAEDLRGTVVRTLILSEDSRLVGDITCQVTGGPCIAFGAPNIGLALNGFSITGSTDPVVGCKGTNVATETGITTNGQANVWIRGPGIVQRFQGDGILFLGTVKGWLQGVTTSTNCLSGIRVNPTSSGISVESNVSVRNGSLTAACGGI
jgi:hypothetical protein